MSAYTDFSYIYDVFMDNVPYTAWADRIDTLLHRYSALEVPNGDEALSSEAGLLADLGCGTGTMTRLMRERGYDCIGIDSSEQMLEVAREHSFLSGDDSGSEDILYLNQDMRSFELYSTVGCMISVCDSINYLLSEEDILSCFRLVNNYLYPRGLFIFDFNTVHYYRDELGDSVIADNRDEGSFIWENYYDPDTHINEYDLTIYIREGELFRRCEETHTQRGYEVSEMTSLVEQAGLELVTVLDSDTDEEVTPDTCRAIIVARERRKSLQ